MCARSRAIPGSLGVFSAPCYGRTIGSSVSQYNAYIVLPCSPDISSEFQLPKGWKFSMLACVSLDRALEAAVQNHSYIPSVSSHRIHHKTGMILNIHYQSFPHHLPYLSTLFVFSFSQGMHLMGNNLRSKEMAQFLSRHTLDNDSSSLLAVFTSTLHKHHRKSSTPIHS